MFGIKVLEERKSNFNGNLRVVKSFGLGTYVQSNGLTQSGGIVKTFWKQTLKKIKNKKPRVNSCLILGLGCGTVVEIVKNLWGEIKIVGVDIDPVMVELGKKYFGLDGIETKIQDATIPVSGTFDLVIVDLYQGDKFPKKFEDEKFLEMINKNNLVVFNRLYFKDKKTSTDKFGEKLKLFFKNVDVFLPIANKMFVCTN